MHSNIFQDLPLENPIVACTSLTSLGYIFHLSGLAAPTIQAWGLLIALARRHSLLNYLIKGMSVCLSSSAPPTSDTHACTHVCILMYPNMTHAHLHTQVWKRLIKELRL